MTRASLALVALLVAGCPKEGTEPVSSGTAVSDERPADLGLDRGQRRALRGDLERRLRVLTSSDDGDPELRAATQQRLEGALAALTVLDALDGSNQAPRDQERAALDALTTWLQEATATEVVTLPSSDAGEDGPWARARALYGEGDREAALVEGLAALRQLTEAGVDSASLRYQLGTWALEQEDGALAAELFDSALTVQEGLGWIQEEAPLQATRARNLALGPDGAVLAEANTLIDRGRLAEADARLVELIANGTDPEVVADATELRSLLLADAADLATEKLARAEQLLQGPGPWDAVVDLITEVRELPIDAVDESELLRIQGWYRSRAGEQGSEEQAARERAVDATLKDARELVLAGEYRAALLTYRKLEGTSAQTTARREAREASETLVRVEREKAGERFVAARKLRDPEAKRTELTAVRDQLASLLAEFPDSSYAERLRTNLAAVERELAAL